MTLSIPRYIAEAEVVAAPMTYEWDDEGHRQYWAPAVPALERKLGQIAPRAIVVLAAGMAEWIAWRLDKHSDDRILFDCIEAVYASVADWRYFNAGDKPFKKLSWAAWKGPVKGPICVAMRMLIETVDDASRDMDVAEDAVCVASLVEHVLPNQVSAYRKWRNSRIDLLKKIEPLDLDDPGTPLPREVLDPSFDFKPEKSAVLLDGYLKTLDHKKNAYLRSPQDMLKAGFDGTPYRL